MSINYSTTPLNTSTFKIQGSRIVRLLSVVYMAGMLLVFCVYPITLIKEGRDSETWTKTQGQITEKIKERKISNRGSKKTTTTLRYQYNADGQNHNSDNMGAILFGKKHIANKFKKGDSIPVWYNPQKPSQSVIYQGVETTIYILPIAGLIAALLGALLFLATFKKPQSQHEKLRKEN